MPRVDLRTDPLAISALLCGWIWAAAAAPLVVLVAVCGQGLGASFGGCLWIGVATAWTHTPWALVNQPELDFATSRGAAGYWFGAFLAVALLAVATVPSVRRSRRLAAELLAIQLAWVAATFGCGWLLLLDGAAGHPGRWLALLDLPVGLLGVLPAVGMAAAVPVTLRLLGLVRSARPHTGRTTRLVAVGLQLVLPVGAWLVVYASVTTTLPPLPSAAMLAPIVTALAIAWRGSPPPYAYRLEPATATTIAVAALAAVILAAGVWLAGRPLGGGQVAGLIWLKPGESNNIRLWIEPAAPADAWRRAIHGPALTLY